MSNNTSLKEPSTPQEPPSGPDQLRNFLVDATDGGLFPLVAYSIGDDEGEGDGHPAPPEPEVDDQDGARLPPDPASPSAGTEVHIRVLTTSITVLTYALGVLERSTAQGYNLGKRMWPNKLQRLVQDHPRVFHLSEATISGFQAMPDTQLASTIGSIIQRFGAPFVKEKGFALVDICGFSRLGHAEQLSQLYSLTNMLDSAVRRSWKFCQQLRIRNRFGRTSTGDGFYFWHDGLGGNADTATFITLTCLMAQCEVMRRSGFPMQLRASFFIGSAFLFFDANARASASPATNAIGAATNGAARLISASLPGQILVNDFLRKGQGDERLSADGLLSQCNQLFREEGSGAAKLAIAPNGPLRVTDKHGDIWYCHNVCGTVPNNIGDKVHQITLGLYPEEAPSMDSVRFRAPQAAKGL